MHWNSEFDFKLELATLYSGSNKFLFFLVKKKELESDDMWEMYCQNPSRSTYSYVRKKTWKSTLLCKNNVEICSVEDILKK